MRGNRSSVVAFRPNAPTRIRQHNLPAQLTSLIGRDDDVAELGRLLEERRLLTLIGTGGVGKTRLALAVATGWRDRAADGAWLVELAGLSNPAFVPHAVVAALGLYERPDLPLVETIVDALGSGSLLLVLDNCEHLAAACAHLARSLLGACPDLRILATSREPLGVAGEITWRVPPLAVPPSGPPLSAGEAMSFGAVRLFVERAAAARHDFALAEDNLAAVGTVCRRLDGLPLAIELAASCIRALTPREIERRLHDRFRLLMQGERTAEPRHRTLRALVDWSFDLLSADEQILLRRLAVFAGGWTLDAAEAVCADGGSGVGGREAREDSRALAPDAQPLAPNAVLPLLMRLVDRSLVVAETGADGTRFSLLETIRAYALEKLGQDGESASVRTRHTEWFLALVETADPLLRGPEHRLWLAHLETEHDNIRAALAWSLEASSRGTDRALGTPAGGGGHESLAEAGVRLAGALGWFWSAQGYFSEAQAWLETALAHRDEVAAFARARALAAAGQIVRVAGDNARAALLLEEAQLLARGARADRVLTESLRQLAFIERDRNDYQRARALGAESLAVSRALGDSWEIARSLNSLALVAQHEGDLAEAASLSEQSLSLFQTLGDVNSQGWALQHLAVIAREQGDFDRAIGLLEQSLSVALPGVEPVVDAWARYQLGFVSVLAGDWDRAGAHLGESLAIFHHLGDRAMLALVLQGLGFTAERLGDYLRAARLLGAAEALRERIGTAWWPAQRARHERTLTALQATLGDDALAAATAEGRDLPLAGAVELGATVAAEVARRPAADTPDTPPAAAGRIEPPALRLLTRREREVAALIARGLTNGQIAEELVLSIRTVERHIENLNAKLGIRGKAGRAAIAAFTLRNGLVAS